MNEHAQQADWTKPEEKEAIKSQGAYIEVNNVGVTDSPKETWSVPDGLWWRGIPECSGRSRSNQVGK